MDRESEIRNLKRIIKELDFARDNSLSLRNLSKRDERFKREMEKLTKRIHDSIFLATAIKETIEKEGEENK